MPLTPWIPEGAPALPMDGAPTTVKRKDLEVKHQYFQDNQDAWENIRLMYVGGREIKGQATRFLPQRPKEDAVVYSHRLSQFTYENNVGSGLGWHEASMFAEEPAIDIKRGDDGELPEEQDAFYTKFLKDCDRKGTTFVDLMRAVFNSLLLYKRAYICLDLPARSEDQKFETLDAERKSGLLNPQCFVLNPLDVQNWGLDSDGNLAWVLIHSKNREAGFLAQPQIVERWYYYDKQTYRVYEARYDEEKAAKVNQTDDKTTAELVRIGYHPLWKQNVVPVDCVEVPDGWWLGNRVYLPAMEHVSISNVLKWSLFMAALAIPVLVTDADIESIIHAEYAFLKLPVGSDYKFAEPSGRAWQWLTDRANTLREEIWRAMYLVAQARSTSATASAQSGVSKQQDMQPSHDVLNGLGDVLRAAMQRTLERVSQIRQNVGYVDDANLTFDVRGFEFEDKVTVDDITVIAEFLGLDIPSDIAEKEAFIRACRAMFRDMNPERMAELIEEIRNAPTKQERAVQNQVDMAKQLGLVAQELDQGMPDDVTKQPKAA